MFDPTLSVLGKNIRRIRMLRGLSQEDLAELSDKHRTYISLLEGGTRNPTVLTLKSLASALECNLTDFFLPEMEAQHEL